MENLMYVTKAQAEKAIENYNGNYSRSMCDVLTLDGADDDAQRILQTAMGEVNCYRDDWTRRVIVAWWED